MFEIEEGKGIHIIGVGGIGMSALADMFLKKGYLVSGSDRVVNQNVERLILSGLKFFNEHEAENVDKASLILYSSAIKEDNIERRRGRELGIRELHRAKMVSLLLNEGRGIAISGAHGKTTTTSILVSLFVNLGLKPSAIVGGIVKELGTNATLDEGEFFIAEADESDGSFLNFFPEIGIITNIDEDHLDYYKNLENIQKSFLTFSKQVSSSGRLIINADDKNSEFLLREESNIKTFSLKKEADYQAVDIKNFEYGSEFKLKHEGAEIDVKSPLSGDYNISNMLAAIAATHAIHADLSEICAKLELFAGAKRRFDILLETKELVVIDDYAHHPTEIEVFLNSVTKRYENRDIVVVFEPHRYSRTRDFWSDFVQVFSNLNELYIADIYSAGEEEIEGIESKIMINSINEKSGAEIAKEIKNWSYLQTLFERSEERPMALITIGAGPISACVQEQVEIWKKN